MHVKMYEMFLEEKFDLNVERQNQGFIESGVLIDRNSKASIPVRNYIPRFCDEGYCDSFGLQWNLFRSLQIDSRTGREESYDRLVRNTQWDLGKMAGKAVLECGCGPGRFTEHFLSSGAFVVAVDMSKAVDVNLENNRKMRGNLLLIQQDISRMPFFYGRFDYVFCYGVLQHTPHPRDTFYDLAKYAQKGGRISVDIYRKTVIPTGWTRPKYFWRPVTRKMSKEKLLRILTWYIPKYIDFDSIVRRIPKLGIYMTGLIPIPCWNYVDRGYSREERIQHAIMDTFDALSPDHDHPARIREVKRWFMEHSELTEVEVFYGSNGVVANARKK
jgi:ubiquinone/menaquinone biosynthesis C-methylase UbiE